MKFYTTRELRSTPKVLWDQLAADGEVVVTNNGRPAALMLNIPDGSFEDTVRAVRQAKAMMAFEALRKQAAQQGFYTREEIDSEIRAVRDEQAQSEE